MVKAAVEKIIGGKVVGQVEFYDAIAEAVEALGPCKPKHVAIYFGPPWDKQKNLLGCSMHRMCDNGHLLRDEKGNYTVAPAYRKIRGMAMDQSVLDSVREAGGLITYTGIMRDFGIVTGKAYSAENDDQDHRGSSDVAMVRRTIKALSESGQLVKYHDECWGLPWNQLSAVPITGEWMWKLLQKGIVHAVPSRLFTDRIKCDQIENEIPLQLMISLFKTIGAGLTILRDAFELSADALANVPEIAEQLRIMAIPALRNIVHQEIREMVDQEMQMKYGPDVKEIEESDVDGQVLQTVNSSYIRQKTDRMEEERANILVYFLLKFEEGHSQFHRAAPVGFYRAVAKYFGVCPAAFSRGLVIFPPKVA